VSVVGGGGGGGGGDGGCFMSGLGRQKLCCEWGV
jgi:hypothetical protein